MVLNKIVVRAFSKVALMVQLVVAGMIVTGCEGTSNPVDSVLTRDPAASSANTGASPLIILPGAQTIYPSSQIQFVTTGGTRPYTYSILVGSGVINSSSGLYITGTSAGSTIVKVVDAAGNSALASITVNIAGGGGGTGPQVLAIIPSSRSLALNNNFTFTNSGGVAPFTYSLYSGVGSIGASNGIYSASATGTAVVMVTDNLGATSYANITVNPPLSVSPSVFTLGINTSATITATGGVPPYSYSVVYGGGSISIGTYTAPASAGTAIARVTDAVLNSADIFITIGGALTLSPASKTVAINNTAAFTASGGTPPYTYSVMAGGAGGTVGSTSGAYTAPATAGIDSVRVTDAGGNTATSSVGINAALQIAPTSKTLSLNNNFTFGATGGVSPYAYSLVSGVGNMSVLTGIYSATSTGTATISVTDSVGNISAGSVTVNAGLSLSSDHSTLAPGNSATLSATGGVGPYSYSVISGGGTISGTTFTAPTSAANVILQVSDSFGNTANTFVNVNSALAISPSTKTVAINNTVNFSGSGGVSPYTYAVVAGGSGGSVNSSTGVYTAPASPGTTTIRVTDSLGNTSNGVVTINAAIAISPTTTTIGLNNSYTFTASGGVSPYTYSIVSGVGTIGVTSGVYSGSSAGTAVVRVTDATGNTSSANVTVSGGLTLAADHSTVAVGNTVTLSASGGVSPYSYSIVSGGGSISGTTFTAPASVGSVTIRVTDSSSNTNDGVITVNAALLISPSTRTITTANSYTFVASGGVSPYTYTKQSGTGSINATTGVYSSASTGSAVILVTDSLGNTATSSVTVNAALAISPASTTITITNSTTFSATGGLAPYVYSISSGGVGSINASSGVYTAPSSAGSASVVVTDSLGNTSTSSVTVNAVLTLSPSTYTLAVNNTKTFTALGGVPSYSYTVQSGSGTITSGGLFTAAASAGTTVLKVTDSATTTSTATVTINAALAASPASFTVPVNNAQTITVSGGVSPYSYSTTSGAIALATSNTANYSAPASAGSATITVTDAVGNTRTVAVTVSAALAISPSAFTIASGTGAVTKTFTATGGLAPYTYTTTIGTIGSSTGVLTPPTSGTGTGTVTVSDSFSNTSSATITLNAPLSITSAKTLAVGNSFTPTVTGGVTPYVYAVTSGGGTVSLGVYTAAGSAGTANLRVTDALGNIANCTVTINATMSISPASKTLAATNSQVFTASGGVSPYTYSAVSGTINSTSGYYIAPGSAGSDTVTATDSLGNTITSAVTIAAPVAISPSTYTILTNDIKPFSSTGGIPTYTYSVYTGTGTMSGSTFAAPATPDVSVIRSTDSSGNISSATVTTTTLSTADDFQYAAGYNSVAYGVTGDTLGSTFAAGYGVSATGTHWLVRKSTDNGTSWSTVDDYQLSAGQQAIAYFLAVDSSNNLYVAGTASDSSSVPVWIVRKSADHGATWSTVDNYVLSSGKDAMAHALAIAANGDVYIAGVATNSSGFGYVTLRRLVAATGIVSTLDSFFNNLSSASATQRLATVTVSPAGVILYGGFCSGGSCWAGASTFNFEIRRSVDSGSTWTFAIQNGFTQSVGDPVLGTDSGSNIYYAINLNTVLDTFVSSNGGTSFSALESTLSLSGYNGTRQAFAISPSGSLYFAGSNVITAGNGFSVGWIRKRRTDAVWAFVENYSLSSGFSSGVRGLMVNSSGTLFSAGFGIDGSSITHWIVRKF